MKEPIGNKATLDDASTEEILHSEPGRYLVTPFKCPPPYGVEALTLWSRRYSVTKTSAAVCGR